MGWTAAVLTISDKGYAGERKDTSGPMLCELLKEYGYQVTYSNILPDEKDQIVNELQKCADELHISLVLTTGGTGFSPRDITPEATKMVIEREVPGIPEAMRYESLKITPKGCLSRSVAGIRGKTLIVNLPGSEKAAKENILAVLSAIEHGLEVLYSTKSLNCAEKPSKKKIPSLDQMLEEAKKDPDSSLCGMYLTHCGVVRGTARARVREGDLKALDVQFMDISYDPTKVSQALDETYQHEGIHYVGVWLNDGILPVGADIMRVIVGGDTRPHTVAGLELLIEKLKTECIQEKEIFDV